MSMDDFMRSLSDQQKAMFMQALQDSGTPPEEETEYTGDEDDSEWTTTMPPHIKKEFEKEKEESNEFAMGKPKSKKSPVKASGENGFVDVGDCKGAELSTPEFTPTKRRRQPAQTIQVQCSICGKSEKINKKFIHGEYHRCSKCCGR